MEYIRNNAARNHTIDHDPQRVFRVFGIYVKAGYKYNAKKDIILLGDNSNRFSFVTHYQLTERLF
jgi:tRNA(Met) C34 N-acetyltransferase TmcA